MIAPAEEIVEKLYRSVHDATSWRSALHDLSAALGAIGGVFIPLDPEGCLFGLETTASLEEACEVYMKGGWFRQDRRSERGSRLFGRKSVILEQDLTSEEERRSDPYYQEFLRPLGLEWWAGVILKVDGSYWTYALQRTIADGPYTRSDAAMLERVVRPLEACLEMRSLLHRRDIDMRVGTLTELGFAAFLLDWKGAVVSLNERAERLVGDGLALAKQRLSARDRASDQRLQALIGYAVGPDTFASRASLPMVAIRREGKPPLIAKALPVEGPAMEFAAVARSILIVSDTRNAIPTETAVLRDGFGLTPAEARLAVLLSEGQSLADAAHALGLSRETIRTRLKSIFAKTGAGRQAELVTLVHQCALVGRVPAVGA